STVSKLSLMAVPWGSRGWEMVQGPAPNHGTVSHGDSFEELQHSLSRSLGDIENSPKVGGSKYIENATFLSNGEYFSTWDQGAFGCENSRSPGHLLMGCIRQAVTSHSPIENHTKVRLPLAN